MFLKRINKACKDYKPLIETSGIITGVFILLLTFWNTLISKGILELSLKQDYEKQAPVWDFEILNNETVMKILPYTDNLKIQNAKVYFSKTLLPKGNELSAELPELKISLESIKETISKINNQKITNSSGLVATIKGRILPMGLKIDYIQGWKMKTIYGIFYIQFDIILDKNNPPEIKIEGILFDKYVEESSFINEIETITNDNLFKIKRKIIIIKKSTGKESK